MFFLFSFIARGLSTKQGGACSQANEHQMFQSLPGMPHSLQPQRKAEAQPPAAVQRETGVQPGQATKPFTTYENQC